MTQKNLNIQGNTNENGKVMIQLATYAKVKASDTGFQHSNIHQDERF